MKIVINNLDVIVKWAEVDSSIDKMTRQFTIKNTEDEQSFFIGDKVEIYNNVGILMIKGEIEYVNINEMDYTYAGRNNAKYIADCFADKTIQFSEKQTVNSVLEEVAGWFDLKVNGNAKMPVEAINTILIGDKIGEAFIKIAKSSGQIITSDATGNLEIESMPKDGEFSLKYGENIRSRIFKEDTTNEYDRYIVVSQSNYLISKNQDVDVQGKYGDGKFVKVIRSEDNLTISECEKLAENEYWKDRRRSVDYSVEMDSDIDIRLNHQYMITDAFVGISKKMNVKRIVATTGKMTDKLTITFENKNNR